LKIDGFVFMSIGGSVLMSVKGIMKIHKHGFVLLNASCVVTTFRTITRNQIIVIATSGCLPNHGLHIYATIVYDLDRSCVIWVGKGFDAHQD
ncbi:MAG: hypothetical protein WBC22_04565, partial [Sedimentisphaerales bacterium]